MRLASVSILSFLCKSASVAASYFARDVIAGSAQLESVIFLATALAVQAVPSAVTLLLLGRFHFSRGSNSSGALMQSLLTREGVSVAMASDSEAVAARQGQLATELAAEVFRLQAENAQLRAKTEQASRLQVETEQQNAQMAKLQQSYQKMNEANQNLEQANQRSQEENAQLRLDVARISQQVTTLACACAFALTLCGSCNISSSSSHSRSSALLPVNTHRCTINYNSLRGMYWARPRYRTQLRPISACMPVVSVTVTNDESRKLVQNAKLLGVFCTLHAGSHHTCHCPCPHLQQQQQQLFHGTMQQQAHNCGSSVKGIVKRANAYAHVQALPCYSGIVNRTIRTSPPPSPSAIKSSRPPALLRSSIPAPNQTPQQHQWRSVASFRGNASG